MASKRARYLSPILGLGVFVAGGHAHASPGGDAPSEVAREDAVEEAKRRFVHGVALYREGDAAAARTEFRRAYELAPNFRILYNLGQVSYALRDYAAALSFFERYLREGGDEVPRERREEVRAEMQALEERVGFLDVRVDVTGAEIHVDDVVVARTPLSAPLPVNVGRHRVVVVAGSANRTRIVEVPGRDTVVITIAMAAPPDAVLAAEESGASFSEPHRGSGTDTNRASLWASWSITAGFAVAAGVSAYLAYDASRDLDRERDTYPGSRRRLDDLHEMTERRAIVTDALLASALIAGGVSLFLTLRRGSEPSERRPSQARSGHLEDLRIGVAGSAMYLEGSF